MLRHVAVGGSTRRNSASVTGAWTAHSMPPPSALTRTFSRPRRNVIGRSRAFTRLATAFGGAGGALEGVRLTGKYPMAVWAVLKPRDSMITNANDDPSLSQDCVMVNYLVAGAIPPHAQLVTPPCGRAHGR
jgi:hypothetical protein